MGISEVSVAFVDGFSIAIILVHQFGPQITWSLCQPSSKTKRDILPQNLGHSVKKQDIWIKMHISE